MGESYPDHSDEENAETPLSVRGGLGYTERLNGPVEVGDGNRKTLVFVDQQLVGEQQHPFSEEELRLHREILDLCGESFIDTVNKRYDRPGGGVRLYEKLEYAPTDWEQLTPNIIWEDPFLTKGNVRKAEFTTWVGKGDTGMRIIARVGQKYFLIDVSVSKSKNTDGIGLYRIDEKVGDNGETQYVPTYIVSKELYRRGRNRVNVLRLIKDWSQAKPRQRLAIKRKVNWNYTSTLLTNEPTPPQLDLLELMDRRHQNSSYPELPSLING